MTRIGRIYANHPFRSAQSASFAFYSNFAARLLLLAAVMLVAAGCEGVAVSTPAPTTVTIVGSAAMQRALRQLTDEFQRQNPSVLFSIRGGGSTIGVAEIAQGEADIAASTLLPPLEDAADAGASALVRTPVGINGLAIVVHPSNAVRDLSLVQLRDIFSGRVLNWQALGSDNGEIQLVSREDGSGSRILFEERVMTGERVSLTAVVMPSSADVAAYVAKRPDAIGYVSRGDVALGLEEPTAGAATQVTPDATWPQVRVVRVEGQLPTVENLAEQRYPLIQPLYLVTQGAPTGQVRRFIDFVLSPAGQAIIGQYHAPIR